MTPEPHGPWQGQAMCPLVLLDRETARAALESVAGGLGLSDWDVRRTAARGLDRGAQAPRNPLEGR